MHRSVSFRRGVWISPHYWIVISFHKNILNRAGKFRFKTKVHAIFWKTIFQMATKNMIWYKITCNCPVHLTNNPKSKSILKLIVYGDFLFLLFWRGIWHLFWCIFFWKKITWISLDFLTIHLGNINQTWVSKYLLSYNDLYSTLLMQTMLILLQWLPMYNQKAL